MRITGNNEDRLLMGGHGSGLLPAMAASDGRNQRCKNGTKQECFSWNFVSDKTGCFVY